MNAEPTDDRTNTICRIRKQTTIAAPIARVWQAISNAHEFGTWFRLALEGQFTEGARIRGRITYPGYEHLRMEVLVEKLEPESYFSLTWHPYAVDPAVDYSKEPSTLVEFRLKETTSGTLLTVTESGFSKLPSHRREEAFRMNSDGWVEQLQNIEEHVAQTK